ncbi:MULTISPECIES: VOC family protein [Streptomyces]|uniref:Glyoxalase/bleomycin resistance protein/dioxygenase n=1 Tax=Streptomyces viridochromogenes TaxID=1938 RepID=A0A0L8J9N7_STRVR|nr:MULTISPECIES: VOC family protein [Streptomyces]KOG10398.1 glyoxalase/bleomycin resistance protein/dioxygenase [Streptomyces viridochromogenes]
MNHKVSLHAYLSYSDASAALDWLGKVGFQVVSRQDGSDGSVIHSELRCGDAVVMVASSDAAYEIPSLQGVSTGAGVYLCVEDPDACYRRAVEAGAATVFAPQETAWGARRARVLDPEGREWTFGSYAPGQTR